MSNAPFKPSDKVIYQQQVLGDALFSTPALEAGKIYVVRDCLFSPGIGYVVQLVGVCYQKGFKLTFFTPANRFILHKAA